MNRNVFPFEYRLDSRGSASSQTPYTEINLDYLFIRCPSLSVRCRRDLTTCDAICGGTGSERVQTCNCWAKCAPTNHPNDISELKKRGFNVFSRWK
ncbi:hypothetical protein CDAR_611401 [Caerostris darwini]|uniref:Uncharacterized protein n=1 Tax=Caerostris darwini TaxID=1538125 RepID=A0AAV4UQ52_9ARAC|nr:hypothetical protein CDAR_611401 [Caerostris darwini]